MTGKDLIEWIVKNDAMDKTCVIQYRDGGGLIYGGEIAEHPSKAVFERGQNGDPWDLDIEYKNVEDCWNCFVL